MKVRIETSPPDREEEVIVRCHEPSAAWVDYVQCVRDTDPGLTGELNGEIVRLKLSEVYYFEVVDRKSFIRDFNCKAKILVACPSPLVFSACLSRAVIATLKGPAGSPSFFSKSVPSSSLDIFLL